MGQVQFRSQAGVAQRNGPGEENQAGKGIE
jgi:hypothetical protein